MITALLMLPQPVLGDQLLAVERFGGFAGGGLPLAAARRWDPAMARLCLLLAAASALAIRARSRSAKAAAILAAGIGAGAMIVRVTSAEAGFARLAVASLVSGALLAAPAIIGGQSRKS